MFHLSIAFIFQALQVKCPPNNGGRSSAAVTHKSKLLCVCPACLYNIFLLVIPLCQTWWESAASTMVWSTVTGRVSSPTVNTSACVLTVLLAVWGCAQSLSLPVFGARPHDESKSGDSAASSGSVTSPGEGARQRCDMQSRVGSFG